MSIERFLGKIAAKFHKTYETKGDALRKGVPRLLSESPKIRAKGWKEIRKRFGPSETKTIYDSVRKK